MIKKLKKDFQDIIGLKKTQQEIIQFLIADLPVVIHMLDRAEAIMIMANNALEEKAGVKMKSIEVFLDDLQGQNDTDLFSKS